MTDNISGTELKLYYRQPTTSERQAFINMCIQRTRNKVTTHHAAARLKYGLLILTGFRSGDFGRIWEGKPEPMASDPDHDDYYVDWKKELETGAGDIVMLLAAQIFEAPAEISDAEEEDDGEEIEENS